MNIQLPPLPKPEHGYYETVDLGMEVFIGTSYTEKQMIEYAKKAIDEDRKLYRALLAKVTK